MNIPFFDLKRLNVPEEFLREEVRNGYTVSEMMKRSWAAQMGILDSLKKLLDKYGLSYFADCGTLLGAVRHGGYIPWDDDLDISMSRKDFMVLLEHADEIGDGLCIRSIYNSDTYMNFHAVVTHKADVLEWDQARTDNNYGCPFICFIDIFPWDYVFRDEQKFRVQKQLYTYAYKLAYDLKDIEDRYFSGRTVTLRELKASDFSGGKEINAYLRDLEELKSFLNNHLEKADYFLEEKKLRQQVLMAADKAAMMCPESCADGVDYCSNLAAAEVNNPRRKEWQESFVELPFEFTKISAPKDYLKVLDVQFGGGYMTPRRFASGHCYPFYRDEVRVLINGDTGDNLPDAPAEEPSVDSIPEGIRPFLLNDEGDLKKIVINGLSATDIINNGHRSIDRIREYLRSREKEDDTIIVTFVSGGLREFMEKCHLEMYGGYCDLIDEIGSLDNVILDEAPETDMTWAFISLCDEYVGDECRLADICRRLEIPVTIQRYQARVEDQKLIFDHDFFMDEVRCGFFISEMMKRFWAAQMVVLNEIDIVCKRHGLSWFADMGTLLGTVRHHGFVPWDDDLDISMLRDDYEEFFKYAPNELPEGFLALTVNNNEEHMTALGRVANGPAINTSKEHLDKYCGCPYVIGVDIFPIDRIYDDPAREEDRKRRVKDIYKAGHVIPVKGINDPGVRKLLAKIERDNRTTLHRNKKLMHELAVLNDRVSCECREETREAAFMYPWVIENRMNADVELFKNVTEMPFENIMIRVPERYDELLTKEYGEYMTIYKGGGAHDYPVYHEQEALLRDKIGHNPFRYTMDKAALDHRMARAKERRDKARDVGNTDVVFLPCREKWWDTMKPLYDKVVSSGKYNVYVLPVPYYDTNYEGYVGAKHYEKEWAAGIEGVTDLEHYDLFAGHSSKIVIQVPYDGWSSTMTVNEELYSDALLKYTDELIYAPCFKVDDPTGEDDKILSALKPFVEQPAVVNADRIIVNSLEMKVYYIETLVLIAGEDTRQYWEKKVCLLDDLNW